MGAPSVGCGLEEARRQLGTFLLWHRALREDSRRLAHRLARPGPVDARGLAAWFSAFAAALHQHAVSEDELLWPAAQSLDPAAFPDGIEAVTDHDDVDAAACAVSVALEALIADPGTRGVAAAAAARFAAAIADHLAVEEQVVVPAALALLGPARWRLLEEQARSDAGPQASAFVFPWLAAHADPDELETLFRWLPASAPVVLAERLSPAYRALAAALD